MPTEAPPVKPRSSATAARFVSWVRSAAPYIHAFRGHTFVIAFGGELLVDERAQNLAYDCNLLAALGIRLVLVHGARPQIEAEMARRGQASHIEKNGLRVTDTAALECVKAANGAIRIELEALLSQGLPNTPMAGSHIRVTGGNFITARPVGIIDGVDYQFTGAVRKVIASEIKADLAQGQVVLISALAASPAGEVFNLAFEELGAAVATALGADKLIYLCEHAGFRDADGSTPTSLTTSEAQACLDGDSPLPPPLRQLLPCAIEAVRKGVPRVHLVDQQTDGGLLLEFFTHAGAGGLLLTQEPLFRLRDACADDIGAVIALISPMEADGSLVRRGRELLEQEIDRFTVVEHDGVLVGCAALYPFGDDSAAELACLAVTPAWRRAGLGEQLLERLEKRARSQKLRQLFVLTTRTAHWFLERGFSATTPADLPAQKRQMYNYQRNSKVFVKPL